MLASVWYKIPRQLSVGIMKERNKVDDHALDREFPTLIAISVGTTTIY